MAEGGGMGRLVGVGFLVGAKDDGASDTMNDAAQATDRLARSAENAGQKSRDVGLLRRAIEGLTTINVANISDQLADLADRAGAGIGAQSTSLEQFGVQFAQTYRAATAGMGRAGEIVDEMRSQVSGVAFSLQVGAEQLLQPITQLASHGRRLEDFGITVRDLGGAIQAGFVESSSFGQSLTELTNSFGLSESQAGGLLDRITAIGEQFGVGQDAVRGFPTALEAMRPILSRFPEMGQDVEGLTESVIRLGMGIQTAAGTDTRTAISQASEVFAQLGEQRMGLMDLVTGLQSEMPNALTEMAIGVGSWDEAMQMATESPARFATSLAGAMSTMSESDPLYQRLRSTLNQFGPGFQVLLNGSEQSRAALEAMNQPMENVEGAFGRIARAASGSTRTFQDNLDLMRDAFQTRMNSIGRATDRDFMGRQRRAYREVGDTIEQFASERGPLGSLTRGFLRVRTFGLVQGLLPQLGALGGDFGELTSQAGPFLHTVNQLGNLRSVSAVLGRVSGALRVVGGSALRVLGPIGLIAGAGYLLYRYWDRIPDLFSAIGDRLERAGTWFQGIGQRFSDWVSGIDWQSVGREAVSSLFNAITVTIESLFAGDSGSGQVGSAIWDGLVNIFTGIGRMVSGLGVGIMERLREGFSSGLGGSAGIAQRIFGTFFQNVYANVQNVITVFSTLGRIIIAPFRALWNIFQPVGAMILRVFSDGQSEAQGFSNVLDGIVSAVEWWQSGLLGAVTQFEAMADSVATFFENTIGDYVQPIIDALRRDLPYIQEQFVGIWNDAQNVFADLFTAIGEVGGVVWDLWSDTLQPIFSTFWDVISQMFGTNNDSILGKGEYTFTGIGDAVKNMWQRHIRPALSNMLGHFAQFFGWLMENAVPAFVELGATGAAAMTRVEAGVDRVRIVWEGLQNMMRTGWEAIETTTRRIIGNTIDYVDLTFQRLLHGWENVVSRFKIFFMTSFRSILDRIHGLVSRIPAGMQQTLGIAGLAGAIDDARNNLRETITELDQQRTAMLLRQGREEQELNDRIEERNRAALEAQSAVSSAYETTRERMRARTREEERDIRDIVDASQGMIESLRGGGREAYRRMIDIAERMRTGQITVERGERARVERLAGAGVLGSQLEEAIGGRAGRVGGSGSLRALEEAIAARGTGELRALDEREIANVMGRVAAISRGPGRGRAEAVQELARMIAAGERITEVREEPVRGRGAAARRGAGRRGGGGREALSADEIREAVREGAAEGSRDGTSAGIDQAARSAPRAPLPSIGAPDQGR